MSEHLFTQTMQNPFTCEPTFFQELKTVYGQEYATYCEACQELNPI